MLDSILVLFAFIISIPLWVVGFELLIALFYKQDKAIESHNDFSGTYRIIMPAHNEAAIIDKTLKTLLSQDVSPEAIVVIADYCSDTTAEIARGFNGHGFRKV